MSISKQIIIDELTSLQKEVEILHLRLRGVIKVLTDEVKSESPVQEASEESNSL